MKYLPRTTVCQLFELGTPIWYGGKPKVGLAENRIAKHNEITIAYKRKSDGQQTYPDHYYFDGDQRNLYPRQTWGNVRLVIVPISELDVLTRQLPPRPEKKLQYITDPKDMPPLIAEIFFSEDRDKAQVKMF